MRHLVISRYPYFSGRMSAEFNIRFLENVDEMPKLRKKCIVSI